MQIKVSFPFSRGAVLIPRKSLINYIKVNYPVASSSRFRGNSRPRRSRYMEQFTL